MARTRRCPASVVAVWRAAIGGIGIALALSGCSTDVEPLARDDYTREVNALCTTAASRSADLIQDAFTGLFGDDPPASPSPQELQALYAGILPAANESAGVIKACSTTYERLQPRTRSHRTRAICGKRSRSDST